MKQGRVGERPHSAFSSAAPRRDVRMSKAGRKRLVRGQRKRTASANFNCFRVFRAIVRILEQMQLCIRCCACGNSTVYFSLTTDTANFAAQDEIKLGTTCVIFVKLCIDAFITLLFSICAAVVAAR